MASERETRTERDFWGIEREYIYEDGKRVGEYKFEDRGGILGFGDERQRVEYDLDGREVGYSRQERRGGFLGFGEEDVEADYDRDGNRAGYSRVEERGGFLGIGTRHERIGYDENDNEVSSTHWERRGGILGIGERRARVTRFSDQRAQGGVDYATPSSESSDLGDALAKLVVIVLVACFLIWLAFNVILPLAIINVSALALGLAAVLKEKHRFLLVVSVIGAGYVLLDYNLGWLTRGLAQTLPFMFDWMSAFVYINISTGLISAYPLLQHVVAEIMPEDEEQPRNWQLILIGCLLAVGCGVFVAQGLFDPQWRRDRATASALPELSAPGNGVDRGVTAHDADSSRAAPAVSASPQGEAIKPAPSTPAVVSPPLPVNSGPSSTIATGAEPRRQNIRSTAAPVAGRTIACVLPDGREERVAAERCESAGGMEYK